MNLKKILIWIILMLGVHIGSSFASDGTILTGMSQPPMFNLTGYKWYGVFIDNEYWPIDYSITQNDTGYCIKLENYTTWWWNFWIYTDNIQFDNSGNFLKPESTGFDTGFTFWIKIYKNEISGWNLLSWSDWSWNDYTNEVMKNLNTNIGYNNGMLMVGTLSGNWYQLESSDTWNYNPVICYTFKNSNDKNIFESWFIEAVSNLNNQAQLNQQPIMNIPSISWAILTKGYKVFWEQHIINVVLPKYNDRYNKKYIKDLNINSKEINKKIDWLLKSNIKIFFSNYLAKHNGIIDVETLNYLWFFRNNNDVSNNIFNNISKKQPVVISNILIPDSNFRDCLTNNYNINFDSNWKITNPQSDINNITSIVCNNDNISNISGIWGFTNLTDLDLSYNQISSLPAEIWNLTNLTNLDLSYNQITGLPAEIWNLTNLTTLDLSDNQITGLPAEIWNLTNLTNLYLSYNQITGLPAEIWNLTNLTDLDLGNNQISSLPAEMTGFTNLTDLDLSYNQISSLPTEIWNLTNLTTLDLSYNQLTGLSAEIWNLTGLSYIYLSDNQISSLPAEMTGLTNLMTLDLSDNQLSGDLNSYFDTSNAFDVTWTVIDTDWDGTADAEMEIVSNWDGSPLIISQP